MMKNPVWILLPAIWLAGCGMTSGGLRVRAVAPAADEAFRKIGIAADLDGYTRTRSSAEDRSFETAWRPLKPEELPAGAGNGDEVKLALVLRPRGRMYDAVLEVMVRPAGSGGPGIPASADHPAVVKWGRILQSLLVRETREED